MVLVAFNPDTDLALANGAGNYTPTEAVSQMIMDLSMLPIWYAKTGSHVLVPIGTDDEFLLKQNELFNLNINLITVEELRSLKGPVEVSPWGWNYSFRNMLKRAGISEEYLPDDAELEARRQRSQRMMVGTLLLRFAKEPGFCGISIQLTTTTDCVHAFQDMKLKGGVVFKEPWSSSGKGLMWCRDAYHVSNRNWCNRVIKTQGYVTVMPIYNKVQDFAMEFYVHPDQSVEFVGYSLFETDKHGYYQGNGLLSDEEIENNLAVYVSMKRLENTKQRVGDFLASQGYQGWVGVDMMICKERGEMCVLPCVEINYRQTMGMVARVLNDQFLAHQATGTFMIEHFSNHEELVDFVEEKSKEAPLEVNGGRVKKGFMPLVPVTPTSQNLAYIEVY